MYAYSILYQWVCAALHACSYIAIHMICVQVILCMCVCSVAYSVYVCSLWCCGYGYHIKNNRPFAMITNVQEIRQTMNTCTSLTGQWHSTCTPTHVHATQVKGIMLGPDLFRVWVCVGYTTTCTLFVCTLYFDEIRDTAIFHNSKPYSFHGFPSIH